jgi:hypothetical protein
MAPLLPKSRLIDSPEGSLLVGLAAPVLKFGILARADLCKLLRRQHENQSVQIAVIWVAADGEFLLSNPKHGKVALQEGPAACQFNLDA